MRSLLRTTGSGPAAILVCCALLVAAIAGPAAAGVSPLSAVKKQLRRTTKIAKTADKHAKGADRRAKAAAADAGIALRGPLVVSGTQTDPVPLAAITYAKVVSVNLSKGRWVLQGATQVNNNTGTTGARDDCRLANGSTELIMRSTGIGPASAGDYSSIIPLSAVVDLPGNATIKLECRVSAASSTSAAQGTQNADLIATRAR